MYNTHGLVMHLQEISQEPTYLEQQSETIVDVTFILCDS